MRIKAEQTILDPRRNWINFPKASRLVKEAVVFGIIQLLIIGPNNAAFWNKSKKTAIKPAPPVQFTNQEVLKNSFISYRATGGFTGVQSYSVLISCVEGRISVLKTIRNPKYNKKDPTIRQRTKMSHRDYLNVWNHLRRQNIFRVQSAPDPKHDITDEFTYYFDARVGEHTNKFKIYGMSRPSGSRYFALKSLMDKSTNMASLWNRHTNLARK